MDSLLVDLLKGILSDLWKYDGNWTFVKGAEGANSEGVLGPIKQPHPNAFPKARHYHTCWTDSNGYMWMYGGYGSKSGQPSK